MKVVEGSFGKDEDKDRPTLGEVIPDVLAKAELDKVNGGNFVLVVDTDDRMTFITNSKNPTGVVYMLEQCKLAVLTGNVSAD